jgi:6-pyruvoyltetrahydropterin/6-carboxytetrahydropterin synthase
MFEVEITTSFSAAHRLRNYNGKCERLHGHNYRTTVAARSDRVGGSGMVIDFSALKAATAQVLEKLDHSYLNEIKPFDKMEPSAENIAAYVFAEIRSLLGENGALLFSVTIWESDSSRATYYGAVT